MLRRCLQHKRLIPLTDWAHNAHSLTVQRGQNAHYICAQSVKGTVLLSPTGLGSVHKIRQYFIKALYWHQPTNDRYKRITSSNHVWSRRWNVWNQDITETIDLRFVDNSKICVHSVHRTLLFLSFFILTCTTVLT